MKITQKISAIRSLATPYFKQNFGTIMLVVFMCTIIQTVPGMILGTLFYDSDFIMSMLQAYNVIIAGPLAFAEAILFLSAFRNQCAGINSIAFGFKFFNKSLIISISIYLRTLFGFFLFVIPGFWMIIKYSLSFYVLADNPNWSPKACLRESSKLMRGNEWKLVKLFLSFAPYFITAMMSRIYLAYTMMELPLVVTEKTLALSFVSAWSAPVCIVVGFLLLIPESLFEVNLACFYDILVGKLVFHYKASDDATIDGIDGIDGIDESEEIPEEIIEIHTDNNDQ